MDSITVVISAPLEDLKNQVRNKSSQRNLAMWLLRVKNYLAYQLINHLIENEKQSETLSLILDKLVN